MEHGLSVITLKEKKTLMSYVIPKLKRASTYNTEAQI